MRFSLAARRHLHECVLVNARPLLDRVCDALVESTVIPRGCKTTVTVKVTSRNSLRAGTGEHRCSTCLPCGFQQQLSQVLSHDDDPVGRTASA